MDIQEYMPLQVYFLHGLCVKEPRNAVVVEVMTTMEVAEN
jgi:hypothetical protein